MAVSKMKTFSSLYILSLIVICVFGEENIIKSTRLGDITGVRTVISSSNRVVDVYRSIPYAKPPTGSLRFAKPQPSDPWNGTLDGTKPSSSCFQILDRFALNLENKNVSEDCLYLNIYVPYEEFRGHNKSVMVWVHGGGYSTGQSQLYDGAHLAVSNDVIIVTINYRLNVFGFFSLGEIKGNFGLWDQIMAIRWVKDNIESFGGNSQSITIFGQSAGGFSVGLLSIIPTNRGLFQRAILQSGTALSNYALGRTTRSFSSMVALSLNCSSNKVSTKNCLKHLSAVDIFSAFNETDVRLSPLSIPFAPVIDGELLTENPSKILDNPSSEGCKFFQSLDVVIGTVSGESSLLITIFNHGLANALNFNITHGIPKRVLCEVISPGIAAAGYNFDTRVSKAICEEYGQGKNNIELSMNILNAFSNYVFDIPTIQSLRAHARNKTLRGRQYQYIFSRQYPVPLISHLPIWFTGAEHSTEAVLMFSGGPKITQTDSLALSLMKYWTHFAKTGNMDVPGEVPWKEYDMINEHYIDFDVPIKTGQHLYKDRVNFWLKKIPNLLQNHTSRSSRRELDLFLELSLLVVFTVLINQASI